MTVTIPEPEEPPLDSWIRVVADVAKLADYISATPFVPSGLRGNAAAVAAAILAGREIGIAPMAALQHMNVIEGRPTLSSQMMRAMVFSAGHQIRIAESSSTRCVLVGNRKGGVEQQVTWTLDDAKRAGVNGRPNWAKYPRQMLLARATSELCRAIFPDVIGGMAYTPEEAEELEPPTTPPITEAAPTRVIRRQKPPPPPVDTPPPAPVPVEEGPGRLEQFLDPTTYDVLPKQEPPPDTRLLSAEQRAKLMALISQAGRMEPRSLRIRTVAGLVRRPITSMAQLTRPEATQLIDTLENLNTLPNRDETLAQLVIDGWTHIDATRATDSGDPPE